MEIVTTRTPGTRQRTVYHYRCRPTNPGPGLVIRYLSLSLEEVRKEWYGKPVICAECKQRVDGLLDWQKTAYGHEAILKDFEGGDGVRFSMEHMPSCYRRGPYKLRVEVASGPAHYLWGCFDDQDQPMRWYHNEAALKMEAESIAAVLLQDRHSRDA